MLFASFSRCRGLKLSRVCCRGGLILRKCSPVVGAVPLPRNYANSAKFDKENIATIPNLLSLGRLVLSPVLGWMVIEHNFSAACGLFVVVGLSDLADGYIARKFKGQSSMLGSVLDPLADKCLIAVLCGTLTFVNLIPLPLAVIILGKDSLLVLASFYLRYVTVPPPVTWRRYWNIKRSTVQVTPTFLGKVNTFFQLSLMALSLGAPVVGAEGSTFLQVLWYVTGCSTVFSGVQYLYQMKGFKILHRKP